MDVINAIEVSLLLATVENLSAFDSTEASRDSGNKEHR